MAFYKCEGIVSFEAKLPSKICDVGTDSARQCGVNPCKYTVSFCKDHGGDAAAIDEIRRHMRDEHKRPL